MSVSNCYILDANAFIEPRNRYYGFDIWPGYWSALVYQHQMKRVCSIDRIRTELVPKKRQDWDDIARWIDEQVPKSFFKETEDQKVIKQFQAMVNWVYSQKQFDAAAQAEFASVADGWVVAYAAVNGLVVVTHEQFSPAARAKVPMPNVCLEFDVQYVDTFLMLRELREKFIRSTKRKKISQ
jgi:hypothetical protein